ncbi:acylneuraminate cytidylyltransferase family protein [Sphaerochaeta sp. PS]|uniref:acylneuraminate cytidylyltransferase family protein n=1 Tax=Sphaerochaeta sp. PS TaxID=3076336 RepID=UPI0028A56FAF|nr:acylneuraminate cytidylyltransferase family protein [Sphaerochaeta sp. PS]MDT4763431.1 acylneuraminate cytidylyltransferase family protein [Sphaerochaeta sp. PS]
MNILCTICGRAGSQGIKNKNIRDFLGYPLPFYTLAALDLFMDKNPDINCDIVVNTDSVELIGLLSRKGLPSVSSIHRRKELGLDSTPKVLVIQNCLVEMEVKTNKRYDMILDLDITSPLRTVADIEALIKKKNQSIADVVFSVTDARRNPYFNMVKKTKTGYERVLSSNFNTRQEAPEIFDMNASLYAYSPEFLKSGKNIFEGSCDIIKMYDTAVLDLDHENDFEMMQAIAQYLFQMKPDFNELFLRVAGYI